MCNCLHIEDTHLFRFIEADSFDGRGKPLYVFAHAPHLL